jgi:simple sugar transport system ATP-binding protein
MTAAVDALPAAGIGAPVLEVTGVSKSFGPVRALTNINLKLNAGEVLGLIGDNGSGKSTLIKMLSGFQSPDAGTIKVNGEETRMRSVSHARALRIECVYQDLALVNQLTVAENMFLGREQLRRWPPLILNGRAMRDQARHSLEAMQIHVPSVDTETGFLSGGQRQAVAIARAVYSDAKILLLDEPLAAMGVKESSQVLGLLQRLRKARQVSILIVAHNYMQLLDVCDRINMLRHGEIVMDVPVTETSVEKLTQFMVDEYRDANGGTAGSTG